jgi:hypothetical protein
VLAVAGAQVRVPDDEDRVITILLDVADDPGRAVQGIDRIDHAPVHEQQHASPVAAVVVGEVLDGVAHLCDTRVELFGRLDVIEVAGVIGVDRIALRIDGDDVQPGGGVVPLPRDGLRATRAADDDQCDQPSDHGPLF